MTEFEKHLLDAIKAITAKGNKAEVEQGRDGLKVIEVKRTRVWSETPPLNSFSEGCSTPFDSCESK